MTTPLMIEIGLHYHTSAGDYGKGSGDNNWDSPIVQELIKSFVAGGLLAESPSRCEAKYYGTEALRVWVEALCTVRWPVQAWVVPGSDEAKALGALTCGE